MLFNRDMHSKTRCQKRCYSFSHTETRGDPVNFEDKNISTENPFFSQGRHRTIHSVFKHRADLKRLFHKSTPPTISTSIISVRKSLEAVNGIVMRPRFFPKMDVRGRGIIWASTVNVSFVSSKEHPS